MIQSHSKECFKCQLAKPLTDFYRHKAMADGHLNKCKECAKKDSLSNRLKNIDKCREYDRKRGARQSPEYQRKYRYMFPKKYKAHIAVAVAIKSGKIRKSACEVCGHQNSVAHHPDYDKPLFVNWLCQAHHKMWHAENGEGINAA